MIDELTTGLKGTVVIQCIGNIERGDDGAGPALAEKIEGKISAFVINSEETPENDTGKIKELHPDTVVLVDAVQMNLEPGSVSIIEKDKLNETRLYTTHNIPLKVYADYLYRETKANIFLIGIQPETLSGNGITKSVRKAVELLAEILIELLQKE